MRGYCAAGLLFLVTTLGVFSVSAQISERPSPFVDTIPPDIHAAMKARLELENLSVTESKSKVRSFIKTLHKERFDLIVKLFNDDWFLGDSELSQHVISIFRSIVRSNPQIPQDASLYLYRSSVPNALSYGEGTIVCSLSLLSRLDNDAQVAFVISHELAHYYLGHTKAAIEKYASLNFDKEFNKKVRSIRNSQYERYSRMKELLEGVELSFNKHSRLHELEADSVGLQLFFNSPYADNEAPVRTMELLDSVDYPIFTDLIDLKKRFDFNEYPFNDSWLTYTKLNTWYAKKEISDTARTHPSCVFRASALKSQITRQSRVARYEGQNFRVVKVQSRVDLIEASYHFKHYGKALFEALQMAEEFPDNAYLHAMIGKCLFQLYTSQKNHELGKALELPDPRFPENYDRFLTFVHALRLHDLEKIAYYYVITQDERFFENEEFLYTLWLCSRLPVSKLSASSVEEQYRRLFPEGKYIEQMK